MEEVKLKMPEEMPQGAEPYDQAERGEPLRGGLHLTFELKAVQATERHMLSYQISLPAAGPVGGNHRD